MLCITTVCKKHNKNYFWITLAVSLAITLLFVSVVNIYPEKTKTKETIQYVTTCPKNTNTTVATKTRGNYTTTVKTNTNVYRNNNKNAVKNVATVTRYYQVYTTTIANRKSTNKINNKQDNVKVENVTSKVINYIFLALVIILSSFVLFVLVVIIRYKVKKNSDTKKYNSLQENEKCIYCCEKIKSMNVEIDDKINSVLNKIQFSKNDATENDTKILEEYYISNKKLKLNNSNILKKYT